MKRSIWLHIRYVAAVAVGVVFWLRAWALPWWVWLPVGMAILAWVLHDAYVAMRAWEQGE